MSECNKLEGEILFSEGMPSNVEDTTEYENVYLAIIIVIIDSSKNHH